MDGLGMMQFMLSNSDDNELRYVADSAVWDDSDEEFNDFNDEYI